MTVKPMNAVIALAGLKHALDCAAYLEGKAQESVNHAAVGVKAQLEAKENVNGKLFSAEWKSKEKASKTVTAITNTIKFGEMVAQYEQKNAAIEAQAIKEPVLITGTSKK